MYNTDKCRQIFLPDLTVHMNCDTHFAVNLGVFEIGEHDEFIFVIKNYDYIDSSYVFLFRARKSDINEQGEVVFSIDPDSAKNIRPGAFYNFTLLVNAFNVNKVTEHIKLTNNGKIILDYGAQDLALPEPDLPHSMASEVLSATLVETDTAKDCAARGVLIDIDLVRE